MRRALMLMCVLVLTTAPAWAAESDKLVPSITVTGEGTVDVAPDMANINVGVVTEAGTAAEAIKANNEQMAQLLKLLKDNNIADKHVQTSNFNVSPRYSQPPRGSQEPPKINGYTVSNQVDVKIMELPRLGTILDALVKSGSNRVGGISFSLAEPKPHLEQARRKAVADAKARAELYAAEAGVKVGKPLLIQEQSFNVPRPVFLGARAMMAEAAPSVPIATGEQTVSAHINVTFQIVE